MARHIFQACPVWIYTQSNITSIIHNVLQYLDVDQENPDKKLVMMYVSSLYESLRQYEPVKPAKRRKVMEADLVASTSTNVEVLHVF